MTETLPLWDPHFHIFDVSDTTTSGHDSKVIAPPYDSPVYLPATYERDIGAAGPDLQPVGGAWLEAMSVCHVDKTASELAVDCLAEGRWASQQLGQLDRKYVLVPSAPLEDPAVAALLAELALDANVRGVRQILNFEPSWPRNGALGNLLDNSQWCKGFALLKDHGFSFDLQLNPHQFKKATAFLEQFPDVTVIIDHLGSPTLADLAEKNKAEQYWQGMEALAARGNTYIKISMLHYADKNWDQITAVTDAIHRVIDTFGSDRCFFASNFPVDIKAGWSAQRLFSAFLKLTRAHYNLDVQCKLFADNAKCAYRADD